mmetsp:Transcript_15953/g.19477  ORF Transcript_15953/g.19477 Transcript_15953/m.19477 type:complete len:322 (+) Transcript_15953:114-1079(+)
MKDHEDVNIKDIDFDEDDLSVKTDCKTIIPDYSNHGHDNHDHNNVDLVLNNQQSLATIPEIPVDQQNQHGGSHSWSQAGGELFKIRGKKYMKDGIKVDSEGEIFQTRGVDLMLTKEFGPSNIGRHSGLLGGKLRDTPTFIINLRFPWGVLVFYHEIAGRFLPILRQKNVPSNDDDFISVEAFTEQYNTSHDLAMYNFIMGDDNYRNSKLKLISKVVEGNILVRKLVKGKPVIIGKKLPVSYTYHPALDGKAEYWEADLDIGSSSNTAKKIVSICKKSMTSLTVDMAFVVEGDTDDVLPERILTSTRIHHLDIKKSPTLIWG